MNDDDPLLALILGFEKRYGHLPNTGEIMLLLEASASVAIDKNAITTLGYDATYIKKLESEATA